MLNLPNHALQALRQAQGIQLRRLKWLVDYFRVLMLVIIAVFSVVKPSIAYAGDPCPISLDFYEIIPGWRDHSADIKALKTQRAVLGVSLYGNNPVRLRALPNSPAIRAGIQDNDQLVSINDQAISNDAGKGLAILDSLLEATPEGVVTLKVLRNNATLPVQILPEPADPVFGQLFNAAEQTDCRGVTSKIVTKTQLGLIEKAVLDKHRGFQCQTAHNDTALKAAFTSGSLLMVRGGTRIIFVMPGWQATCVDVEAYDKKQLSSSDWAKLLKLITSNYVDDRYKNP